MQYLKIMKYAILSYGNLWMFFTYFCVTHLLPLVWALVARLVSNGCSSLVHHLPIT